MRPLFSSWAYSTAVNMLCDTATRSDRVSSFRFLHRPGGAEPLDSAIRLLLRLLAEGCVLVLYGLVGMRFAPHTVTHPVLARTSDVQSAREIEGSKTRLAQEARSPQDVFCYPNGQRGDFGAREYATLRKLGIQGSVVGWSGYGEPRHFAADDDERFQINRFSYCPESSSRKSAATLSTRPGNSI